MAIKKHTDGNILFPFTEDSNCCCSCLGYCCINGDCVDLDPSLGLTCQTCENAGGQCHCSLTKNCANQDDCDCSQGSGDSSGGGGGGGSGGGSSGGGLVEGSTGSGYCAGTGYGTGNLGSSGV